MRSDMEYVVIPDIHGRQDALAEILVHAGVAQDNGRGDLKRTEGRCVVQLGDLANCVRGIDMETKETLQAQDVACLSSVGEFIDVMLVGNHEHPYFGGPQFSGFGFDWDVYHELHRIWEDDRLYVSFDANGVLLTHAGMHPNAFHAVGGDTPATVHTQLEHKWEHDPCDKVFSAISPARGGWNHFGSILWRDAKEEIHTGFPQVFGHSVGERVRSSNDMGGDKPHNPWWCIDVGTGKHSNLIAYALISESGEVNIVEEAKKR